MPINTPEYVAGLAGRILGLGTVSDERKAERAAYNIAKSVCRKAARILGQ
jgi:hypothetical protein